jgi:hypothetical protein
MSSDALKFKPLPKFQRNFKNAIAVANWIRQHNYYASAEPVNISQGGVWPQFKDAVKRYKGGKEINRYYVSYLTNTSICKEMAGGFEILIPESFNPCHRRFAICKELCHILTDEDAAKSRQPIEQLNRALQTVRKVLESKLVDSEINQLFSATDIPSEDFCFLLALEILIPVNRRDDLITNVRVKGVRTYDVAVHLRIPESLVIFFDKSDYNSAFKRLGGIECKLG